MSAVVVLVGLLVGMATLVTGVPRRRMTSRPVRRPAAAVGMRLDGAPAASAGAGAWAAVRSRRGRGPDDGQLAAALVHVASLVRAGAAPAQAWSQALRVPVPGRVPTVAQLAVVADAGRAARGARGSPGPPLEAVVAAARVADELGAPLAAVLDQVAAAVVAQSEAASDVRAALAGPRSSARVLVWLPLLGVVLGTALGADPLTVLLGGGLGTAAGVLGVALVLVGRWWTAALLRRAAGAGGAT